MTTLLEEPPPAPSPEPAMAAARPLSERLTDPLRMVTGRMRVLAFLRACFQCVVAIGVGWLFLIFLLGSFPGMPIYLTLPLALVGWGIIIAAAVYFFRPIFQTRDISSAARLVDEALPDTQERISSAIQLSNETDPRFAGSPELVTVLIRQAEHAAEQVNPSAVVSGKSVAAWFGATLPLMVVWFILLLVSTTTLFTGLRRIFNPFAAITAAPTARLEVDPKDVTASQGDKITINLTVSSENNLEAKADQRATIFRRYGSGGGAQDVTADMERTGPHTFVTVLDNVQQTFTYRVSALGTDSQTYTITVDPRPAASSVEVKYIYPAYTHLSPHTDPSHDGAIDALVGTQATVTIDSPQALRSARMVIGDNGAGQEFVPLVAAPSVPNKYSGQFTISKTTQYHFDLVSDKNISNSDDQPRPISARVDMPPQVNITSPAATLKVRSDDTVPVHFTTTDDFGITRMEASIQIDDLAPTSLAIPIKAEQTKIDDKWQFDVQTLLRSLPPTPANKPHRFIRYQLRAVDNRDPSPQAGLSVRQTLEIDDNTTPLAQREDRQAAKDLAAAIRKATANLDDAKRKLTAIQQAAQNRPLTDKEKQQAETARTEIAQAASDLKDAAAKADDSRLTNAAQQARQIADQPLQKAQENTAAGELASDQPTERNKSLDQAQQNLTDARQKLDQLAKTMNDKSKDQPLAQDVERLADQQRKLADQLAQHPNDPKLQQEQRDLQKKLDNVIKQNPELQKPAEAAAQNNTNDVSKNIQDLQQSQKPLNDQTQQQQSASNAPAKLNDLAKQQDDLNKQVQNFNQQQADPLKNAGARTPEQSQMDNAAKDLQNKQTADAAREQTAAAQQLDQTADRLDKLAQQQQANARAAERADKQAQQTAQNADAIKQDTDKLGQQIQQDTQNHNPQIRPSDPANQQANKIADQMRREARQLAKSPDQQAAAQQVEQEANAAKADAKNGNAASAQQHLQAAAQALAQAAHAAQQAASTQNPQDTAKAAAQARDLANKQHDLANQTAEVQKNVDQSQNNSSNSDQTAQQQKDLADKMDQAAKNAQELSQKTQSTAPELSQRANEASKSLQQAAQSQRNAAQAAQQGENSRAAQEQQKSAQALSSAQQKMSGQPQSGDQQSGQQQSGQQQAGQQQGGQQPGGQQAGGQQQSPGQSGSQSGQQAQGQSPSPAGTGAAESAAAQNVQSARAAQSEAAAGNPDAARRAADQLAQAGHQLMADPSGATPSGDQQQGSAQNGTPSQSGAQGQPQGDGQSQASAQGKPSDNPNGSASSGGGVNITNTGAASATPPPKSVTDIGISPSEWAKLPAGIQDQLLHSAQQSGPPAYRDMIKNYYSRISRLQDSPGAAAQ